MGASNAKSIMNLIVQKHKTDSSKSRGPSFKAKQQGPAQKIFIDKVDESRKMREDISNIFIMNSPKLFIS